MAKKELDALELSTVAGGNGHANVDGGRMHVAHGAAEGFGEGGADLGGG